MPRGRQRERCLWRERCPCSWRPRPRGPRPGVGFRRTNYQSAPLNGLIAGMLPGNGRMPGIYAIPSTSRTSMRMACAHGYVQGRSWRSDRGVGPTLYIMLRVRTYRWGLVQEDSPSVRRWRTAAGTARGRRPPAELCLCRDRVIRGEWPLFTRANTVFMGGRLLCTYLAGLF